ncbi:MAG: phosphotransferase, partial [Oscillospiraceae bacterium]|nr:phosphotransferase [Oscillospiraceae bacterium]
MKLSPLTVNIAEYPAELQPFLADAKLCDSSCSPNATVLFIDKGDGYFLKSAAKGALEREAAMTRFFHGKGLSAEVFAYISAERDYMLTAKIPGDDCLAGKYLEQPERLAETLAERLFLLHDADFAGCPVPNHTELYLANAKNNYRAGIFGKEPQPDYWGCASADEAYKVIETQGYLLRTDT